jgi:glycosyltransferase involved in cell wall biosynthesis
MIHALMPSIHDRLTGGSIYNRRILACLAKSSQVELYIDSAEGYERFPGGLWLVDSLCLETGASHLANCADASGILITHYLEAIDPQRRNSARAGNERTMLRHFCAAVTTSRFARRALMAGGFQGPVKAILPGLSEDYRQSAHRPLSHGKVAILTVANVVPDKGLVEMLCALERLSDLSWSWELIGDVDLDPEFSDKFRARVHRSRVCDRITIRCALSPREVLAAYDRSDIFALPSQFETCSMATMEAMARGLPVAAFQVGGLPDLLPKISRDALAKPGDADGLTGTVRRLIEARDERRRLGDANRSASSRFPSWEECGSALERFIRRFDGSQNQTASKHAQAADAAQAVKDLEDRTDPAGHVAFGNKRPEVEIDKAQARRL